MTGLVTRRVGIRGPGEPFSPCLGTSCRRSLTRRRNGTHIMMRAARMTRRVVPLLLLLAGCTDALLQPQAVPESTLDDRLTVRGRVCTRVPSDSVFPVKVDFLVDKSGSMCVSDPPGVGPPGSLCELAPPPADPNDPRPGRVKALDLLVRRFDSRKDIYVALDGFESRLNPTIPAVDQGFIAPAQLDSATINNLQQDLGKGTDYQGALAQAYTRIEQDILNPLNNIANRPRTRYVVVLMTDGVPYPRCSAVDNLPDDQYATPQNPWGIWRDSPPGFCNAGNPDVQLNGYTVGTDRNQNYQILGAVQRLAALKDKYNIGDIRLHTVLIYNIAAVEACNAMTGGLCAKDLYNGLSATEAHAVASQLLTRMAEIGGGTYQEFTTPESIQLATLDYGSLRARFAKKELFAENVNAFPTVDGPEVDSDGDGLPDSLDGTKALGTQQLEADSDGDGFSDSFEVAHKAEGFDPLVPDPRGCKAINGVPARYSCQDVDGDGLSEAAEAYLGTNQRLFDTDADGIPDGLEVKLGLDPTVPNSKLMDHDLDGVPDILEVFQHTNPLLDDRVVHLRDRYLYDLSDPIVQTNGTLCYDFRVSNIRLLTPERVGGQKGYNLVKLTFGEAPESNLTRDYGVWYQACAWAQFAPPSVRVPLGPELVLDPNDFNHRPQDLATGNLNSLCRGTHP